MFDSLNSIYCPRNNKVNKICLTHTCQGSPFQCHIVNCPCTALHTRCKTMQWHSASQYLQNWTNGIGKEGKEFINRMEKIYANLKNRLERQKKIFDQFCKDLFLGKDYGKLMRLVQKKQHKNITPQLLSSSLKALTQPIDFKSFSAFTINELKQIDQQADQLFLGLDSLYRSKEIKTISSQRPKRANSAILFRETTKVQIKNNSTLNYQQHKISSDLINLKLDITYPKTINSKIVPEASQINRLLMRKIKKYHLAYRATESSFKIADFYHKMKTYEKQILQAAQKQNKKIQLYSLIITKNEFNKVLGGLTPIKWEEIKNSNQSEDEQNNPEREGNHKKSQKFKSDASAKTFLFSLDLMQRYELKCPSEAIYCGRKSIGFGHGDLKIVEKGNQFRKNYCRFPVSYNYPHKPYSNWSKSSMELSGSRYSVFFKLVEWEAFFVEC